MKVWLPILILLLAVTGFCVWDSVFTAKTFNKLNLESTEIYETLLTTEITDDNLKQKIFNLNNYWTKKMDTLSVSISRKDLQPISDYLQYLHAAATTENQDEAVTYSRLIYYNILGLKETYGISLINLL